MITQHLHFPGAYFLGRLPGMLNPSVIPAPSPPPTTGSSMLLARLGFPGWRAGSWSTSPTIGLCWSTLRLLISARDPTAEQPEIPRQNATNRPYLKASKCASLDSNRKHNLRRRPFIPLVFGRVPTTPDTYTSAKASRYKWRRILIPNWRCTSYFLPKQGHAFAKASR